MAMYIFGIVAGLVGLFWGFYVSQAKAFPTNIIGGIVSIGCLLLTLVSVLLICVPGFFD
ncbi:MAG: hypothetical protein JW941_09865 [Candidatus Coatesbacteria bacterium]|nr:hypothetical protein [Candidatus Coatesbacteria bacterium]